MKNLTVSQEEIINTLKNEFRQMNSNAVKVSNSIIDQLFTQANEYNISRDNFYNNIERNNAIVKSKKEELAVAFYNKLVKLFKAYDVAVVIDGTFITVGYNLSITDEPNFKKGYFWMSSNVTISYAQFNSNSKRVDVYGEAVTTLGSTYLTLDNFEETDIFKEKVIELFKNK